MYVSDQLAPSRSRVILRTSPSCIDVGCNADGSVISRLRLAVVVPSAIVCDIAHEVALTTHGLYLSVTI